MSSIISRISPLLFSFLVASTRVLQSDSKMTSLIPMLQEKDTASRRHNASTIRGEGAKIGLKKSEIKVLTLSLTIIHAIPLPLDWLYATSTLTLIFSALGGLYLAIVALLDWEEGSELLLV